MQEHLTTEQKIDFIYNKILEREKKEKKALIVKWGFRIFILLYIWYFFLFALPKLMDSIKSTFTPNMAEINLPEGLSEKLSEYLDR